MKRLLVVVGLALGLTLQSIARSNAEDLTNRLQITGIGQAAWPLGQSSVTNITKKTGYDFGGMVAYGLDSHLSLGLSYDNIYLYNNFRVQPALVNTIYRMFSDRQWTPTLLLGAGLVQGKTDSSYEHFAGKAGLGLEYFVCHYLSLGPQVTFLLADVQTTDKQYAQVLTAGLVANLFFGGESEPKVEKQAVEQTPVPAAVIALAVSPATANVGPGQTVQLNSSVTGTNNTAVTWSIDPPLGTVSSTGLYTAPATIELAETVTVTATSAADGTKMGASQIKLTPPASAPKEVDIRMDILFDTNKTNIKPQYDGEIQKVAKFMKTYTHSQAEIDGYTDNVGKAAYNMDLSQRRADSVREYMVSKFGIDASRLTAKGYGETNPIASNSTAVGRAKNRRVVAAITAQVQQ